MSDSFIDPKTIMLFIILVIFGSLAGYLYYANKKMYDAGIH